MKLHKFFDCSVNGVSNKEHNETSYGPLENDLMRDLNQYSILFGFRRTYNYQEADVFITNTTYTEEILEWSDKHSIPKIKRMDGIYWQDDLIHKNDILNEAAMQSDHVIFISEYSKDALKSLYGLEPNNSVILNNVDDTVYYTRKKKEEFRLVTSSTNWNRDGKRFYELIEFAKRIDDKIYLIGHCNKKVPDNVIKIGYIKDPIMMSKIIGESSIFISLFFRDAGSKVTCQGVKCKLPILYTNSGGLPELIRGNGIQIVDYTDIDFRNCSVPLNIDDIVNKYKELKGIYKDIEKEYKEREAYYYTIENYFNVMESYL